MSPLMFVVLVLAAYRLTRLVTRDTIWAATRDDRLVPWLENSEHIVWRKAAELVGCPYCAGYWVSGIVVLFAANTVVALHWEWVVLVWWAVAGGQALCSAVDDRLNG